MRSKVKGQLSSNECWEMHMQETDLTVTMAMNTPSLSPGFQRGHPEARLLLQCGLQVEYQGAAVCLSILPNDY